MFLQATWPQEFSHCQVAVINSVSLVSECCKHLWRKGILGTQLPKYPSQRLVLIKVMGTIASQLKALSQNTPHSSIRL